ncbi:hypothetical protein [Streptomyces sp. MST-110588]|uniref:hypothetical protein n=1 Tax=Streptomyces sp. MST-110588 TaxID=2833628 RepID=UPI001F5CAB96|nr:hypothetical protein [Streptomyces sp. MST-110588]UNO38697.1 hypothetical protein KGS77_02330 [Streptomyces sp. MST-110588]
MCPPLQGHIDRATEFAPEDEERQRQDFLAGTVPAAGAGIAVPGDGPGGPLDALFMIFVHEDQRTFGPAPQLKEAFALLDRYGAVGLHDQLSVGTGWAGMGGRDPLVKLKLQFHDALSGSTGIVLAAHRNATGGGMSSAAA